MIKVCFIGACGHCSSAFNHLKTRKDIEFCGFAVGSQHENGDAAFTEMPHFDNYITMLDLVKPNLAVVSPVFGLTGSVIIECAKRGVDVFAEKPIASSLEELERVKNIIAESGIKFCAMHYLRFNPAFYHAAKLVRNGKIGKLQMITAQKSYKYGIRPVWYSDPELYGGTIPWVGIHAIDWVSHFSGKRFISVTAQSIGENPEMAALCQFELEDNIIASVNIDYYRPKTAPTHDDDRIRCVGTQGVLEVCGGKITLINEEGCKEEVPNTAPNLLSEFLDNREPISVQEILHITEAAISAKESAKKQIKLSIGG